MVQGEAHEPAVGRPGADGGVAAVADRLEPGGRELDALGGGGGPRGHDDGADPARDRHAAGEVAAAGAVEEVGRPEPFEQTGRDRGRRRRVEDGDGLAPVPRGHNGLGGLGSREQDRQQRRFVGRGHRGVP